MHLRLYWTHAEPILKEASETTTSRLTILNLRMSLEKLLSSQAFMRQFENSNNLQIKIFYKMRRVLNIQEVNHRPQIENQKTKSGRCFKCVDEIVGTAD